MHERERPSIRELEKERTLEIFTTIAPPQAMQIEVGTDDYTGVRLQMEGSEEFDEGAIGEPVVLQGTSRAHGNTAAAGGAGNGIDMNPVFVDFYCTVPAAAQTSFATRL